RRFRFLPRPLRQARPRQPTTGKAPPRRPAAAPSGHVEARPLPPPEPVPDAAELRSGLAFRRAERAGRPAVTDDSSKLAIHFEGFWQCRLATDPDPSREPRGVSGYVFAVGYEPDLDGIIRLQDDGKVVLRDPFPPYREALNPRFGVYVTEVEHDGQTLAGHVLLGGQVRFLDGARFVLRNQIVADGVNRLVPPIVPFTIEI